MDAKNFTELQALIASYYTTTVLYIFYQYTVQKNELFY